MKSLGTWILLIIIIIVIIAFVIYLVYGGIGSAIYTTPGTLYNGLLSGTNVYLSNVGLTERNKNKLSYLGVDSNGNLREYDSPQSNGSTEWEYLLNTNDCQQTFNSDCSGFFDINFCKFCQNTNSTTYTSISLRNLATRQYITFQVDASNPQSVGLSTMQSPIYNGAPYEEVGGDNRFFPSISRPANTNSLYSASLAICDNYPTGGGPEGYCLSVDPLTGSYISVPATVDDFARYYVIPVDNTNPPITTPTPSRTGNILLISGIVIILTSIVLFVLRYFEKYPYILLIGGVLFFIGLILIIAGIYNRNIAV